MLIDSHAHIYDEKFGADGARSIVESMAADGLESIITVGCDMESSRICVELAEKFDNVYATVGVHPYYPETVTPQAIDALRKLASSDRVVAIGEFGFDYHHETYDKEAQRAAVVAQYDLARELRLPMVFHVREGAGDFYTFSKDREFPQSGVLHCFAGSVETAEYCLKKGFYLSFGGKLTYRNSKHMIEVAAMAPLDRIILETDAPYLAPSQCFGQINYPKNVAFVRDKLVEIKGISAQELERLTVENTKRLFYKMNTARTGDNG